MIIQHNILALNANRQLGIVTNNLSKSTEKLSSGYKINRAADDAAGLSISEKMRKQIRGLTQASQNIEDGISLVQVADGALNETTDILQRMNVLSIQAANGTNSINDRTAIQQEIDQLSSEINRIANTTNFNSHVYPLKGISETSSLNGTNNIQELPFTIRDFSIVNTTGAAITYDGIVYNVGDTIKGTYLIYEASKDNNINSNSPYKNRVCVEVGLEYFCLGRITEGGAPPIDVDSLLAESMQKLADANLAGYSLTSIGTDADGDTYISRTNGSHWYYGSSPGNNGLGWSFSDSKMNGFVYKFPSDLNEDNSSPCVTNSIWIQSTNETQKGLEIHLVDASMKGLFSGETSISVLNEESCCKTIDMLNEAIKTVSTYRSYFGSIQNRLEHAYNINQNIIENTQYAESQIRDTDMATEMVGYSNYNILAQVGQSILAQANQSNQGVLSLIA